MQSLADKKFLGIDESNHGKFPEIYVGVYSSVDSCLMAQNLGKKRAKNKNLHEELNSDFDFRFVLFNHDFKHFFSDDLIKIIALNELVSVAPNLEQVIVDGLISDSSKKKYLYSFLGTNYGFDLRIVPKADITYPIVNEADSIANKIFRGYLSKPHDFDLKELAGNLIEPDLNYYTTILRNTD